MDIVEQYTLDINNHSLEGDFEICKTKLTTLTGQSGLLPDTYKDMPAIRLNFIVPNSTHFDMANTKFFVNVRYAYKWSEPASVYIGHCELDMPQSLDTEFLADLDALLEAETFISKEFKCGGFLHEFVFSTIKTVLSERQLLRQGYIIIELQSNRFADAMYQAAQRVARDHKLVVAFCPGLEGTSRLHFYDIIRVDFFYPAEAETETEREDRETEGDSETNPEDE